MTAIWLLSTRGRPNACQEVLDACEETGMRSRGVVYVDETVDEYRNLRLPKNWTIHCEPEWGSLQASLQWCFRNYPDADQYGWLADDTYPRTKGWDKDLEAAAGRWKLSYCNDLWISQSGGTHEEHLHKGLNLSSGLCWGGDLVRTVGWWALPGVIQAGIDTAWVDIVHPLGLYRYLPDTIVEHKNWRTGKRPYDDVDRWERAGVGDYISDDCAVKNEWVLSADYRNILRRVHRKTGGDRKLVGQFLYRSMISTGGGTLSTHQERRMEHLDPDQVLGLFADEEPTGDPPTGRRVRSQPDPPPFRDDRQQRRRLGESAG